MWAERTQRCGAERTQRCGAERTQRCGAERTQRCGAGGPGGVGLEDPRTHHVIKVNEGVVNCHHPQPLLQAGAQHQATNAAKATLISAALIN